MKKEIFLFVVLILSSISLSIAQDNWGDQGGSSGSSLGGANKDSGIFVGLSYPSAGIKMVRELKPKDASIQCTNCPRTETSPTVNSSAGLRVGWQSGAHQIALASYQWQTEVGKVQNQMVVYDYVFGFGFFTGAGLGTGRFDSANSNNPSGSGLVVGIELGYQFALLDFLQLSIGYLTTSFSYVLSEENISICTTTSGGSSCQIEEAEVKKFVNFRGLVLNLEFVF